MTALVIIVTLLWAARTWYALLFHVHLWQLKEYRLDRLSAHLGTAAGRRPLLHPLGVAKAALLIALAVAPLEGTKTVEMLAAGVLVLAYAVELVLQAHEALRRRMRRPVLTAKAFALTGGAGFIEYGAALLAAILSAPLSPVTAQPTKFLTLLLVLDRLLPVVVAIGVGLLRPATNYGKGREMRSAAQKRHAARGLVVIGVTGSFGKTSTKEFITKILTPRLNVLATPGNTNTPLGISRFINSKLGPDHQVMVVEMGAYRRGEIAELCAVAEPRIGVITAIDDQHLALFGSMRDIVLAKMELVDGLPDDGVAVLNVDSEGITKNIGLVHRRCVLYGTAESADFRIAEISVAARSVTFHLVCRGKMATMTAPLLGRQSIPNIAAAAAVASELGMTLEQTALAVETLRPLPRTMYPLEHPSGALFVDDTYSASSGSVNAALDYLAVLPDHRRVLVFSEILELGPRARIVHRAIGARVAAICDLAVVLGSNYAEAVREGVEAARVLGRPIGRVVFTEDHRVAARAVSDFVWADCVVVFEGRGAEHVLNQLHSALARGAEDEVRVSNSPRQA